MKNVHFFCFILFPSYATWKRINSMHGLRSTLPLISCFYFISFSTQYINNEKVAALSGVWAECSWASQDREMNHIRFTSLHCQLEQRLFQKFWINYEGHHLSFSFHFSLSYITNLYICHKKANLFLKRYIINYIFTSCHSRRRIITRGIT